MRRNVCYVALCTTSGIVWSYVLWFGTTVALHIPCSSLRSSAPSQVLCRWVLTPVLWLTVITFLAIRRRRPHSESALCVVILSFHLLVAWIGALILCWPGLRGAGCLHRVPFTSIESFLTCFGNVFPITFIAIAVALATSMAEVVNCEYEARQ